MPRFVVLRHEFPAGHARATHWDLMFQWGSSLRTWALDAEPLSQAQITARALADHRIEYLDYEGPVSDDRGMVARWDQGEYELNASQEHEFRARLRGRRLGCNMTLRKAAEGHFWTVSFSAEPTTGSSSPST